MKKIKVAINGCGRIGRAFLKLAIKRSELEVVAVNDLGDINDIAYLLNYDSVYGNTLMNADKGDADERGLGTRIKADENNLVIGERKVLYLSEKDPAVLPWGKLGVDVVVESTGLFTSAEKAQMHIAAGAKRVVITAPIKEPSQINADKKENADGRGLDSISVHQRQNQRASASTVLMGINEEKFTGAVITSNASCTTNAASPLIAILDESVGIEKAVLNTVHAYTASQAIVDGPNKKDFREGRAGAVNIVPSSTGAAIAVTKAFPKLKGLFDGISIRVPVPVGSIVDVTFIAKRETSAEEVNRILEKAATDARWKGIFTTTREPLVSRDIVGDPHASIADLSFTRVVGGNLVKVLGWYDNVNGIYEHFNC